MSKKRAIELWDDDILEKIEVGNTKGLQQIHHHLFQDVFSFAGEIRVVDLSKGNFRFAPVLFLESNLKLIDQMPENSFVEIIDQYIEMNVAHPFREGNGRATRIWLDLILRKNLQMCIKWANVDQASYLQAMERSPVNSLEIRTLLESALTDQIDNRKVYMKGIQASYHYENQAEYDVFTLEPRNSSKDS